MSSKTRLDRAYRNAHRIAFNDNSKIILFSDCHRGDNSFADDFANNRNIWPWFVLSIAAVGSSAMSNKGLFASAIAIIILCHSASVS